MSANVEVTTKVREYPGTDTPYQTMFVSNHWNDKSKVVIELDGKKYTFIAEHIRQALQNAQNAH